MASAQEENIRKIVEMRAEHRKKIADLKKKRFTKMITNILVIISLLTGMGVAMTSIGYIKTFGFLVVGLLPGLVALVTDMRPGRFASKTVLAFNLSGMSPHLASILYSGSPNQTAWSILYEPQSWLLIYGFAAFGWALVFAIPYIAELYLEVKAAYTVKKLEKFKKSLIDEWGNKVKE